MWIYSDRVLLVGDFNIHDDNLNDGCAKEYLNIVDNLRISLHVTKSKHNKGQMKSFQKVLIFLRLWGRILLFLITALFCL